MVWELERALLAVLNADSTGSPTWFLDACGMKGRRNRRLLLSNHDTGVDLHARALQPGLDFSGRPALLFDEKAMGVDAVRLLVEYLKAYGAIHKSVSVAAPIMVKAAAWAKRLPAGVDGQPPL